MRTMRRTPWRAGWIGLGAALLFPVAARAHCDSWDGPVVAAAQRALQEGEVTPVLQWVVRPQDEKAIADAFAATLKVRNLGPDARALADQALDKGSADALVAAMSREFEQGLRTRFARVLETRKRAGDSVTAGREYVAAYVDFIHYVESLHEATRGAEPDPGTNQGASVHPGKGR